MCYIIIYKGGYLNIELTRWQSDLSFDFEYSEGLGGGEQRWAVDGFWPAGPRGDGWAEKFVGAQWKIGKNYR
jgi:hypothetical protein